MKKLSLFLACIVCLLSVVRTDQAVAKGKDHKPTIQAERNPAAARSRLEKEVRHELVMLPYFTVFDNLATATRSRSSLGELGSTSILLITLHCALPPLEISVRTYQDMTPTSASRLVAFIDGCPAPYPG